MPSSTTFRVHDYILMEVIYTNKSYSTSNYGFTQIYNAYDKSYLNINKRKAANVTRNIEDFTSVETDDGSLAVLSNNSAFYYPSIDPNITATDLSFSSTYNMEYDTIRFHILSGYNFSDIAGFFCETYIKTKANHVMKLCGITYLKQFFDLVTFSKRPFIIDNLVFDKYIEVSVPSVKWLMNQQTFSLTGDTPVYKFTGTELISGGDSIYCNFKTLSKVEADKGDGIIKCYVEGNKSFVFPAQDFAADLAATITEDTSNGLFYYWATYQGQSAQDFIYQMNSIVNNNFFLIHELSIMAQVGANFQEIDNFTITQKSDYATPKRFRPIIPQLRGLVSFTINYTLRVYNAYNGNNYIKTSSVSTFNVNKYALNGQKLNVDNATLPNKVYNRVVTKSMAVTSNIQVPTQTKISYVFIESTTVGLSSAVMYLTPFDNVVRIDVVKTDGSGYQSLDYVSNYYITFKDDTGNITYVPEMLSANGNKNEGELYFKITEETIQKIQTFNNRNFYVIAKAPNKTQTALGQGKFSLDNGNDIVEPTLVATNTVVSDNQTMADVVTVRGVVEAAGIRPVSETTVSGSAEITAAPSATNGLSTRLPR